MLISLIFIFRCLVTSLAGYEGNLLSTLGSKLTSTYYLTIIKKPTLLNWHQNEIKKMLQAHAYFIGHCMYVLSDNHVTIV